MDIQDIQDMSDIQDTQDIYNIFGILDRNTRNIQSDSNFDTTLDPYSIPEMNHTWKNYFTGKGAGMKVGHNAWKLKYKRGFIKKGATKSNAITGYFDKKVRFSQKI